ncbi:MAG: PilZ domain-containing protein [Elusimicrobia bacterium]|nr:PilZ domain-containing protein [Elusimicrobiota bacterium]
MTRYAKEARRAPREPHDSVLEILDDAGHKPFGDARLVDVSSLGVSFTSTRVFPKGAAIRARLRLLDAGVLEFKGTVVRVKERSNCMLYAVKFDSVRGKRP